MKRMLFLVVVSAFFNCTAFASGQGHPCVRGKDLAKIAKCIEALELRERIVAVRDSVDQILSKLTKEQPEFTVRLFNPDAKLTQDDAVKIYRDIDRIFSEALKEATTRGKRLVFIVGEDHTNRTALMLGQMFIRIAQRHGAQRFGWETARESYQTAEPQAVHYKGLFEQISRSYDDREHLPSETEPEKQNYLGGTRANQEFEVWHLMRSSRLFSKDKICLSSDCWYVSEGKVGKKLALFAADPAFWNWARWSDYFGYFGSREPGMASTLVGQALSAPGQSPVVAVYGYAHFKGIAEEIQRTGHADAVLFRALGLTQSISLYNPKIAAQLPEANAREIYNIDEYLLKPDHSMILTKRGPETAKEAIEWAEYADQHR